MAAFQPWLEQLPHRQRYPSITMHNKCRSRLHAHTWPRSNPTVMCSQNSAWAAQLCRVKGSSLHWAHRLAQTQCKVEVWQINFFIPPNGIAIQMKCASDWSRQVFGYKIDLSHCIQSMICSGISLHEIKVISIF